VVFKEDVYTDVLISASAAKVRDIVMAFNKYTFWIILLFISRVCVVEALEVWIVESDLFARADFALHLNIS